MIRPLRFAAILLTAAAVINGSAITVGSYFTWPGVALVGLCLYGAGYLLTVAALQQWGVRR